MKKFEYKVFYRHEHLNDRETEEYLNELGQEGWEILQFGYYGSLLKGHFAAWGKRELPAPSNSPETEMPKLD